jgi:hypothetical protein
MVATNLCTNHSVTTALCCDILCDAQLASTLDKNVQLDPIVLKTSFAKSDLSWIILYLPLEGPQNTVGHWVLLWSPKRGTPVFFDSFGAPPCKAILKLLKHLHRLRGLTGHKVPYESSNTVLQDIDASSCGFWAMSLLYALSTGANLTNFISNFSDEFDQNEETLHEVFRSVDLSQ